MKRAAVVLCGGRSSRMGRAKAWLPWFGSTMIEHVVGRLHSVVDEVIVVTSDSLDLPSLDARIVIDLEKEGGPLVGLREGLHAATADLAFVTSVDAPYLEANFVETMFSFGRAAAPTADGHVQVLSAIYPCSAWKEAGDLLSRGKRRPLDLLEALDYMPVPPGPPVDTGSSDDPPAWQGFNTPAEYLDAVRAKDPNAQAEVEFLGRAAQRVARELMRLPVGTLGEIFARLPDPSLLVSDGRLRKTHLVCLGGRDVVRDLAVPVGPGERLSVIDALAGG